MEAVILMKEVELEMASVQHRLDRGASKFRDQGHGGAGAIDACMHQEAGSGRS